ncbi:MAG: hypothetical protein L3J50_09530 [Emcibacter sp.]|nr:hypothetical protein [Emcibacter sp.]
MKQTFLRIFGLLGTVIFIPLFVLTFSSPHSIELAGKSFIQWKLTSVTEQKIDAIHIPTTTKFGAYLNKKAGLKLETLKKQLKDELPKILADQIAKMSNLNCECRQKWEGWLAKSLKIKVTTIEKAKVKVAEYSQVKYMAIVTKLTRDVRIFFGVNAIVFLLLLLVSFLKPKAVYHLFVPAVLLMISSIFCSYFYIFEQNWFFTILYDDYMGFAYLGYLTVTFSFLCDIIFNKGRVTTEIMNGISSALGQLVTFSPC